jgi:hypothetical protein
MKKKILDTSPQYKEEIVCDMCGWGSDNDDVLQPVSLLFPFITKFDSGVIVLDLHRKCIAKMRNNFKSSLGLKSL